MNQKLLMPMLGVGALAVGGVLLVVLRMVDPAQQRIRHEEARALPQIAALPEFSLVDQAGAPFTKQSLGASKVWVADFIFTTCQGTCPTLTAQMKKLGAMVPAATHLVSFSVDPERDTPAVLAAYAAKVPADPARWSFVTGPASQVRDTVVNGFKMTDDKVVQDAGEYDVVHGNWFVLGDASGRIRGYYHVETEEELETLAHDVGLLAEDKAGS